jgi:hypothetical protein
MRILRIRRGFTTNSSGANEFLPSDSGSTPGSRAKVDASPSAAADAFAAASAAPSAQPSAASRPADSSSTLTSVEPWGDARTPSGSSTSVAALCALVVVVAAAFAVSPIVRLVRRKRADKSAGRAPPGDAP